MKLRAYAEHGTASYWIGEPVARTVTVLALQGDRYVEVGVATPEAPLAEQAPYELEILVAPAA